MFTSKDVMDLRARTGVGMMDCKKALVACDGDMEKAIDFLREKGMATAAKKASRVASEGIVYAEKKGDVAVLVEVNCESDFVAKGEGFTSFVKSVADYIAANEVSTIEQVVDAMREELNQAIAKIGEKIDIRRFVRLPYGENKVDSYIHMGGKIGVLVEVSAATPDEIAHDIALQIAAAKPTCVSKEQVPQEDINKEKEILKAQALNEPKPKPLPIIEKMVEGRIQKYYKEVCLLEQEFVKDNTKTISQLVAENAGAKVIGFVRYEMGEGLEKKADTFVDEIAASIANVNK